ncbi:sigma-E processing peptidase SpoIIGA [Bacillus testis]|uniref:sigma-E processing peptidase SpoIIGA n=1 Tax=Bacillus testis TaxID=1622072 RepID=UPI00067F681E|nr:sigma-E processing peptidase SpoIIGA [Bacillus testis]
MVAYVDLIILLNWFFDCLLLYWASLLLKRKVSYIRIGVGGLAGAALILLAFSPFYEVANLVIVKIGVSFLMVLLVFGYKRWSLFLKALSLLYFVTFLSGGILLGTHYLFSYQFIAPDSYVFYGPKSYGDPVSWLFVMIGFPAGWLYSRKVFTGLEVTNMMAESMMDVKIRIKDRLLVCRGLIDTGNQLYEPITNAPVMIASAISLRSQLPQDVLELIEKAGEAGDLSLASQSAWGARVRIIPYKVVGKDQQLLIAFRPDWIELSSASVTGKVTKGLVAFTMQTLSHDDCYHSIIHPRMLIELQQVS